MATTVSPAGRAADRAPAGRRLDFLDALRGVAVGLVLLQHVGELTIPAVHRLSADGVQLGQLGVMVFFLCSGFIIPASLDRADASADRRRGLRAFWRGRVFRLFPLYWLSLAAALALTLLGRQTSPEPLAGDDWLVNATMLQTFFGAPHALGLYWTLTYELVFYGAVSLLYLLGWHRRSVAVSLTVSGGCLAAALLCEPVFGRPAPLALFCLATMFTGTLFHRWHSGTVSLRTLVGCVTVTLAAGGALLFAAFGGPAVADPTGANSLIPMTSAWFGAYAVFCAGMALRSHRMPPLLLRLGVLSYSVYLVQALVLLAVPALPSAALTVVVWVGATLVLSVLTHRFVELPAVALGRRARRVPPAPGADPGEIARTTPTAPQLHPA